MCQKKVIAHSDSNSQLIKYIYNNPKEFFAYKPQYKYLNTVYIQKTLEPRDRAVTGGRGAWYSSGGGVYNASRGSPPQQQVKAQYRKSVPFCSPARASRELVPCERRPKAAPRTRAITAASLQCACPYNRGPIEPVHNVREFRVYGLPGCCEIGG